MLKSETSEQVHSIDIKDLEELNTNNTPLGMTKCKIAQSNEGAENVIIPPLCT